MRLEVRARVCPTENEEKVKQAIRNLFDVVVEGEEGRLSGWSEDRSSLRRFYTLLRSQGILDTAREVFLKNAMGNQLSFRLNKQAAYAGAVNFHGSSQLGSIHVTLIGDDLMVLIDWLAPSTKQGQ